MNTHIAAFLKDKIAALSYVDKIAGLVRPISFERVGNDEQRPGFFRLSKVEQQDLAGDSAKRMGDWAVKFLAR